ncbi:MULTISPECIES: ATP-binding protein [unclassified Streptomyces]|uniref:ATP-binding protein n=1 Tax=unclassified Streptomyces TaxID=2593676 RepID=UPI00202566D1|nr:MULTISPECIES: ATP-binding protein [unclassified Streptomyces]MCX4548709.1 ATP-binding protein [Streptomyces sp. NBC_01500]
MTATRPNAIGAPGYSETMPCVPESAGRARNLIRMAIHTWGLDVLVSDGELIASELVGNAVQHSRSHHLRAGVTLLGPGHVVLSVSDRSTAYPRLQKSRLESVTGRGLLLVDELAHRWDADIRRWGKVVWAELRVAEDPPDGQ